MSDGKPDDAKLEARDSAAAPEGSAPAAAIAPKPKNFAERLLRLLESGVASKSIWWASDGTMVAFYPRDIKHDDTLTSKLQLKNYNSFIRNLNRWGFKRTASTALPDGSVAYKCSLFQRSQPHLIKHMRMDSDVQEVFMQHQPGNQRSEQIPGVASYANAPQSQFQNSQPYQIPDAAATASPATAASMCTQFPQQQQAGGADQLLNFLQSLQNSQQGNTSQGSQVQPQQQPFGSSMGTGRSAGTTMSVASTPGSQFSSKPNFAVAGSFITPTQQQPSTGNNTGFQINPPGTPQGLEREQLRSETFQRIVTLSRDFLQRPSPSASSATGGRNHGTTIRSLLHALVLIGESSQQDDSAAAAGSQASSSISQKVTPQQASAASSFLGFRNQAASPAQINSFTNNNLSGNIQSSNVHLQQLQQQLLGASQAQVRMQRNDYQQMPPPPLPPQQQGQRQPQQPGGGQPEEGNQALLQLMSMLLQQQQQQNNQGNQSNFR